MDVSYQGDHIEIPEADRMRTVAACQTLCMEHTQCHHFAFEDDTCYIIGEDHGEEKKLKGAVSGPKSCFKGPGIKLPWFL